MLPEGGVAPSEERIFARVPAEEMGRMSVLGMGFAAFPDFVEQERAGRICRTIQIVAKAAVFFSSGSNHAAQFRFEDGFLTFACSQLNN